MSRAPDFSTRAGPSQPGRGREIALLAAAVLVFLASGFSAFRAGAEARAAGAYLAGLRGEIEQERARLRALEGRQRSGASVLTSKLVLTAEAPPARVLADLAALLPPDVRLDSLALSYGARLEIEAQAVARRPASYDLFLERLSASPLFGEILPGSEARAAGMRGTLRMVYRRLP